MRPPQMKVPSFAPTLALARARWEPGIQVPHPIHTVSTREPSTALAGVRTKLFVTISLPLWFATACAPAPLRTSPAPPCDCDPPCSEPPPDPETVRLQNAITAATDSHQEQRGCFWHKLDDGKNPDPKVVERDVENLAASSDAPYICSDLCAGSTSCGDARFWQVVRYGLAAVTPLVEQLDNATLTEMTVPLTGGNCAVADVALYALDEIIRIPRYEILGLTMDPECGECAWWHFVRESQDNRRRVKEAVGEWLAAHEGSLQWRPDDDFAWIDCQENCQHPAGGYYVVRGSEPENAQ